MATRIKVPAKKRSKIALALAGGGPLGAIYEIGALCALEESVQGLDLTGLDHYIGVSAGGFIAAGLANGMSPRALCDAFIENDAAIAGDVFDPAWLMVPAYDEFAQRALRLPGLLLSAWLGVALGGKSWLAALEKMGAALPTGLFSNHEIDRRMAQLFAGKGRTNDFRQLKTKLTLVATHLDSGQTAPFGQPGWDHIPISTAVQASAALPGLFPPVEIEGQHYVDGALKKTMHASVAMDEGVDLMLCLNPLVSFDITSPGKRTGTAASAVPAEAGARRRAPRIVDGGLPAVLSQTFRTMIHSRMELGMKHYERAYPATDIVLLEPDQRDEQIYSANTFSYSQRRHLAEHAYQTTRQQLRAHGGLEHKLARHGLSLNRAVLDSSRQLLQSQEGVPMLAGLRPAMVLLQQILQRIEVGYK